MGFPGDSEVKASACNVGDLGSIPGSGRSPGEGNGNPLQYSCPKNPMDRGAWWATVQGVAKSRTRLSDFISLYFRICGFQIYFRICSFVFFQIKSSYAKTIYSHNSPFPIATYWVSICSWTYSRLYSVLML